MVTGSRAEYGLLYWLLKEIQATPEFDLQIAATGMHLSPEFGSTYQKIENVFEKVDKTYDMYMKKPTKISIRFKNVLMVTFSLEKLNIQLCMRCKLGRIVIPRSDKRC